VQYVAYHFQVDDIRSIVPRGQEMLMLGRALSRRLPSIAREDVMQGFAASDLVTGDCFVIAFNATRTDKVLRASIDDKCKHIKGYKGMRVIELGKAGGYDLVEGRVPKP
jgi:predicted DNA repair protein MutK